MDAKLVNLGITHAAPNTSAKRRETDWEKLSNENLKFMLDLLSLHFSPYEVDCANEVSRRIEAGTWLDLEQPPPVQGDALPAWMKVYPFRLLWKQGRGIFRGGGGV